MCICLRVFLCRSYFLPFPSDLSLFNTGYFPAPCQYEYLRRGGGGCFTLALSQQEVFSLKRKKPQTVGLQDFFFRIAKPTTLQESNGFSSHLPSENKKVMRVMVVWKTDLNYLKF